MKIEQKGVYLVAELSANHNHKLDIAVETIRAAKRAGADAIKLQTYTPDTLTIDCNNEHFRIDQGTLWDGKTLYQLYQEAYTPWEWHKELFTVARQEGLDCFSSPFDKSAVDLLETFDVPYYKIASFEIQDIPLISYAASKKRPMILSTGIAELSDIELAVETCRNAGSNDITLLKCTSSYPAPLELSNLRTMVDMRERFNVKVGLSDHTLGIEVSLTATALGATMIEKHFILDKTLGGPDSEFSLNPDEFKNLAQGVRNVEKILGNVTYEIPTKVKSNRKFARSLFIVNDIKKGDILNASNVRSIRPGYGLHPKFYSEVLGKKAKHDIERGTPLSLDMIT